MKSVVIKNTNDKNKMFRIQGHLNNNNENPHLDMTLGAGWCVIKYRILINNKFITVLPFKTVNAVLIKTVT